MPAQPGADAKTAKASSLPSASAAASTVTIASKKSQPPPATSSATPPPPPPLQPPLPPPPAASPKSPAKFNGSAAPPGSLEEIEVLFVKPLEKKYECPVCSQVLRYPMQIPQCGHRCCSACLPELLRVSPRCPLDQVGIDKDRVLEDRAFQTETEALEVKCSYSARGCKWTGMLVELMPHLESCDRGLTVCPLNCGIVFEKRFLSKHSQQDCAKRQIDCQMCGKRMIAEDEHEHSAECPKAPVQCPNGCNQQKGLVRDALSDHVTKDCPKQKTVCPLQSHGCEYAGTKVDISVHMQEKVAQHTELLCASFKSAREQLEAKEKVTAELEEKVTCLEKRIRSMESAYGPQMIWRIDNYAERLSDAKSGKKATIYSAPFLSHRHGYKLGVSTCLFGDGPARGKFMSVFLCILKSDNDSLLQWPFGHRVTFELLDQRDDVQGRRNVVYAFKPNMCEENRPFLDKPIGERNPSFGSVRFVDLEALAVQQQFVRDDSIFIKVTIDCETMRPL